MTRLFTENCQMSDAIVEQTIKRVYLIPNMKGECNTQVKIHQCWLFEVHTRLTDTFKFNTTLCNILSLILL